VVLYRSDHASVSGNIIGQSAGYAMHLMSTTGATVTGNTIDGARKALTALALDTSSNVIVTMNTFSNFTQHGVLLYAASPMVVDLITITGNTFSNTTAAYGTQLSGGATLGRVVFSGNTIV
jgi:nitrous oxidase accessory protein NosD